MNNKGWGLREMIILCVILVIALLIVVLITTSLFGILKKNKYNRSNIDETRTYTSMELEIIDASKKYIKKIYEDKLEYNDPLYIKVKSLQNEKMLKNLYDVKDAGIHCSGYTKIVKTETEVVYEPYMKCGSNYQTEGYTSRFDG